MRRRTALCAAFLNVMKVVCLCSRPSRLTKYSSFHMYLLAAGFVRGSLLITLGWWWCFLLLLLLLSTLPLVALPLLPILPSTTALALVVVPTSTTASAAAASSSSSAATASTAVHRTATVVGIISARTLRWAGVRSAVLSTRDHAAVDLRNSVRPRVGTPWHYHLGRISGHLLRHSVRERRCTVRVGGSGELLWLLWLLRRRRRLLLLLAALGFAVLDVALLLGGLAVVVLLVAVGWLICRRLLALGWRWGLVGLRRRTAVLRRRRGWASRTAGHLHVLRHLGHGTTVGHGGSWVPAHGHGVLWVAHGSS